MLSAETLKELEEELSAMSTSCTSLRWKPLHHLRALSRPADPPRPANARPPRAPCFNSEQKGGHASAVDARQVQARVRDLRLQVYRSEQAPPLPPLWQISLQE